MIFLIIFCLLFCAYNLDVTLKNRFRINQLEKINKELKKQIDNIYVQNR